jgi:hypothetical protein
MRRGPWLLHVLAMFVNPSLFSIHARHNVVAADEDRAVH